MKFSKAIFLIVLPVFFVVNKVWSQSDIKKTTLYITVKDQKKSDIVDAVFFVDSISTPVLSRTNGTYKIKIDPNCKRIKVFSYSRGIVEKDYNGKKKMKIIYQDAFKPIIESTVNDGQDNFDYRNIYEMIRSRVAGVQVTPNNRIYIRGTNSLVGNVEPLFIVNGSPVPSLANISPFFVDSISILKGPEAAVYGSRAAGGVILIKLK